MACQHTRTVETAGHVLTRASGHPIDLQLVEPVVDYEGAAAIILRCRLDPASAGQPAIVIVKQSMSETQHIFREWANLEFLNSRPQTRPLVPKLYGGDEDAELLVMEDVAAGRDLLGNIVEGQDPGRAKAGLVAFQNALGRLHAATIGCEESLARHSIRRDTGTTSRHVINRVEETLAALPGLLAGNGVPVNQDLVDEIVGMQAEIIVPGPFHAFVHGDAAIGNVLYGEDRGIRLIDFESSAYRHALLDGSYSRMRYLLSVWARRMPLDLQRRLLGVYREELQKGCPEAADDRLFNRGLLACSTFWLAAILAYLPSASEQDRKFGRSTWRQRIVAALDHFAQLSDDLCQSGPLAAATDDLRQRLRAQWDEQESTMRLCNAFQED